MKNITVLIAFIAFYLFHNHNTLVASEFDLSSGNGLSQEDYFEKVLLIRDPLVVDNPLRTGLNPIKKITQTDDGGIMITTKFPHGRETGDSVVMDGVRGLFVPGFANCNFLAEKIDELSFKLRHFRIRNFKVTKGIGEIVRGEFTTTLENEEENGFLLGVWTFGHLMGNMMGQDEVAGEFLKHWFSQWNVEQLVNGHKSDVRNTEKLEWPKDENNLMSLSKAPFRLLSIVNRIDLWKSDEKGVAPIDAGEGRFVFCLTGGFKSSEEDSYIRNEAHPIQFTVIFEYEQGAVSLRQLKSWVQRWDSLATTLGEDGKVGEEYLTHLDKQVTDHFTKRGRGEEKPNANLINQIRTNEIFLKHPWQMREFALSGKQDLIDSFLGKTELVAPQGSLKNEKQIGLWTTTTKANPDFNKFANSSFLSNWLHKRQALVGSDLPWQPPVWTVGPIANEPSTQSTFEFPELNNQEVAHKFGLMTCTGCHTKNTGTRFTMIKPRANFQKSGLSPFLIGKNSNSGDLAVRADIMNDLASDFGLRKPSDLGVANTMDFGGDASLQSAPSNILTLPKPKRQNRVH